MKLYRKGADYERKLVNRFRESGHLAFRAAGSKSGELAKIDVFDLDPVTKKIFLIQCKVGDTYTDVKKIKLRNELKFLEGKYEVFVDVI